MSYSMMGGTGMGAAGTGAGAGPAMMSGLSPQVAAMLRMMAANSGGAAGGPCRFMPPAAGPQMPMTGTPMAGMIGAPGGMAAAMQQHAPIVPQLGPTPGMPGGAQSPQQGANPVAGMMQSVQQAQQMQALMNQLKGGQSGVGGPAQLDPSQNPNSTMAAGSPDWLQTLMARFGQGGMPAGAGPAGGLT